MNPGAAKNKYRCATTSLASFASSLLSVRLLSGPVAANTSAATIRLTITFDVVDGARSRQRSAIGWFVGDGEKTRCFGSPLSRKGWDMRQKSRLVLPCDPEYTAHREAAKRRQETREWLLQRERPGAAPPIVPDAPDAESRLCLLKTCGRESTPPASGN
jgi:hypothetical protein